MSVIDLDSRVRNSLGPVGTLVQRVHVPPIVMFLGFTIWPLSIGFPVEVMTGLSMYPTQTRASAQDPVVALLLLLSVAFALAYGFAFFHDVVLGRIFSSGGGRLFWRRPGREKALPFFNVGMPAIWRRLHEFAHERSSKNSPTFQARQKPLRVARLTAIVLIFAPVVVAPIAGNIWGSNGAGASTVACWLISFVLFVWAQGWERNLFGARAREASRARWKGRIWLIIGLFGGVAGWFSGATTFVQMGWDEKWGGLLGFIVGMTGASPVIRLLLGVKDDPLEGHDKRLETARRTLMPLAEDLRRFDDRAPVIYLRGFKDDTTRVWRYRNCFSRDRRHTTLEALIEEEARAYGPMLAIGEPGELPREGAGREYAADNDWRDLIARRMQEATLIVAVVSPTEGLLWELNTLIAAGHGPKLLVLVPPSTNSAERVAHLRTVFAGSIWHKALCENFGAGIIAFCFDANGGVGAFKGEWMDQDFQFALHLGMYGANALNAEG